MEPVARQMRPAYVRYRSILCRVLVVSISCYAHSSVVWADDTPASDSESGPVTLSDIGDALGWLDHQLEKAVEASRLDQEVLDAQSAIPPSPTSLPQQPETQVASSKPDAEKASSLPEVVEGIGDALGWLDHQLDAAIAASQPTNETNPSVNEGAEREVIEPAQVKLPKEHGVPLMQRVHPLVLTKPMVTGKARSHSAAKLLVQDFPDPVTEEDSGLRFVDLMAPPVKTKSAGVQDNAAPIMSGVSEDADALPIIQSASNPMP